MSAPHRTAIVTLLVCCAWVPAAAAGEPGSADAPRVRWVTPEETRWVLPLAGAAAPGATTLELTAPPWHPMLPDEQIPLLDGTEFDTRSARGHVLLLDFWASWCGPCLKELPELQALYDSESKRGFKAIAVNAREQDEIALSTAESLRLTLPIGKLTRSLNAVMQISNLPTVVLADREGRIRRRWNGYPQGLELEIAKSVRELLEDDSVGDGVPIAEILVGEDRLRVRWRKEVGAAASGLGIGRAESGAPRVYLSEPGRMWTLGEDGRVLGRFALPPASGALVGGDFDADGSGEFVGYRPGGDRLVLIDAAAGRHRTWNAPSTVMDVAVVPASADGERDRLAIATLEGLWLARVEDDEPRRLGPQERLTAVAVPTRGVATVALASTGSVEWYAVGSVEPQRVSDASGGWALVSDSVQDGVGVLPAEAVAAATGSFLAGGRRAIAVAGETDLWIADLQTGETEVHARWPGITALAAGDLDGDGSDELFVAENRALTVLECP